MKIINWMRSMLWWEWLILFFILVVGFGLGWWIRPSTCSQQVEKTECSQIEDRIENLVTKAKERVKKYKLELQQCKEQLTKGSCPSLKIKAGKGIRIVSCTPKELCR